VRTDPAFTQVYLDTSIAVGALHPGTPNATACTSFVRSLARNRTRIYISLALRLDFGRAVRRLATNADKLPIEFRQAYTLDQWVTNPLVRHRWLNRELKLLDELLAQFTVVTEIPLTEDIWRLSIEIMGADGLDATDALHVAAARSEGIPVFATCDRDFRRITTPHVHFVQDVREVDE